MFLWCICKYYWLRKIDNVGINNCLVDFIVGCEVIKKLKLLFVLIINFMVINLFFLFNVIW